MIFAISSVTQAEPVAPIAPVAVQARTSEESFKQLDGAGKGYLSEADLASTIVTISPEGESLSQADAALRAREAFVALDADQNGRVTLEEFKAGKDAAAAPPAGPGTAPRPSSLAGGGTDPNITFDPADSNQNGSVSQLEQAVYASRHNRLVS